MQLDHQFTIPQAPDDVFALLLDVERIAPCLPGAQLLDHDGDTYTGSIRVKVGPLVAAYEGTAAIGEVDESNRTAVLHANGSEVGGQGGADARVRLEVQGDGEASEVRVRTDLDIRGRAAQFGRGVMEDVAGRILEQFATNLEAVLLAGEGEPARSGREPVATGSEAQAPQPPSEPLDLLGAGIEPAIRRALPLLLAGLVGFLVGRWAGRRSGTPPAYVLPPGWLPPGGAHAVRESS